MFNAKSPRLQNYKGGDAMKKDYNICAIISNINIDDLRAIQELLNTRHCQKKR
jgi:hypothetical protein